MCETTSPRVHGSAIARPRWGLLYAGTLPQLAALGAVEAVHAPHPVRLMLRCLLALGVFATMSVWLRTNRPAFDLQNWCDCAGARMTIRVIESCPPTHTARPLEPALRSLAPLEEEYEIAGR